jgi:hypothetical protein
MKSMMGRLSLVGGLVSLAFFGLTTSTLAQEDRNPPGDRLERLERRVNEMADRQDQLLRSLGGQMERQGPMARPGGGNFRPPMGQPGNENLHPPIQPPGGPVAGLHNPPGARAAKGLHDLLGLLFLIGIICNILLAVWIFTDIRKRGEGSGIFIAMALVAGIPAALIYALTRIGDKKT